MFNELTIGDLNAGLFGKPSKSVQLSTESINTIIKCGGAEILTSDRTDYDTFSNEMWQNYNEAILINNYVDNSMESLLQDIRLSKRIHRQYSLPMTDPIIKSLEDGTIKTIANKVKTAVVSIIRRLILSVSNFVKAVSNWIGGLGFKQQEEFYKENMNAIEVPDKFEKYQATLLLVTGMKPNSIPFHLNELYDEVSPDINNILNVTNNFITTFKENTQTTNEEDKKRRLNEFDKNISEMMKKTADWLIKWYNSANNPELYKQLQSAVSELGEMVKTTNFEITPKKVVQFTKILSGARVNIKALFYGGNFMSVAGKGALQNPTPKIVNIKTFLTKWGGNFKDLLGQNSGQSSKVAVVAAKKQIKEMSTSMNFLIKTAKQDMKNKSAIALLSNVQNICKVIFSFMTSWLLTSQGEYIKQRNYAYNFAKMLVNGDDSNANPNTQYQNDQKTAEQRKDSTPATPGNDNAKNPFALSGNNSKINQAVTNNEFRNAGKNKR